MGRERKTSSSFYWTCGLSSTAACVAESATFPLDMIRSRLQAGGAGASRGMLGTGLGILRDEGASKMYRGLTPACMRHVVFSGLRVSVYEQLRNNVFKREADGSFALWKGALCGMSAGLISQFIASPTDIVKTQMQNEGPRLLAGKPPRFRGTVDAFRVIARENGVRGLWKGVVPNCQRAMFVQLGDLTTYDFAKRWLLRNTSLEDSMPLHALASGCAGLVAATLGAPADVVKTRVMNDIEGRYSGALDCLRKTVAREGVRSLWSGWLPTWMRMAPWSLVFFITFEKLREVTGQDSF